MTSAANQLSVVDPAVPATDPTSPSIPLNLLLALLAGGLVGVAAAFLIEFLDDSIKGGDAAESAITGLPVLGTVPRLLISPPTTRSTRSSRSPTRRSAAAEAFRMLRTNLEFAGIDAPVRTIVVTSALPGEGKTTIATNLAVAFARDGTPHTPCRRGPPTSWRPRGVRFPAGSPGLTDVLRSDPVALHSVLRSTQEPNLRVVRVGCQPRTRRSWSARREWKRS